MTDEYRKILDWCDQREAESKIPHALITYRAEIVEDGAWTARWFSGVRVWNRQSVLDTDHDWHYCQYGQGLDSKGSTPEEAIAKLAEALGL